jgi:ATP-dependent DNA ligase
MKEELRKDISENPTKYQGECMEISAMERTKDGFFRHPQFLQMRDDKNQKDCIIGQD